MDIELAPLTADRRPDVDEFLQAVVESKASLTRWMPWCHPDYGSADVERWFDEADGMWRARSAFPMVIRETHSRRLLGTVGLHDLQLYGKREGEIGYWVRQSARGRGVAATAIRTMAAFAFNELALARVSMRIRLDNHSSRRAAERARARFEGLLRYGIAQGDALFDAALYALVSDDMRRDWAP